LIGDSLLTEQVGRLLDPLVAEGTTRKDAFQRVLMSQNMSEAAFLTAIRNEMGNTLLRNAVGIGAMAVSPAEAADLDRYQNETRTIAAVFLADKDVKDYPPPTDEVLLPFYQAGQERYALPETRAFTLAILSDKSLAVPVTIPEEDVRAAYEEARESGALTPAKAPGADLVAALDKDLGVEKQAAPEQTPEPPSFEEIRETIAQDLMHARIADALADLAGEADDRLAAGMALEDVAKEMDMALETVPAVRADGSTPADMDGMKVYEADRDYIMETVFELMEGEISPVMELSDGRYAAIRLDHIVPKNYQPFDAVKKSLRDLWVADQQQVLNRQKAEDFLQALVSEEVKLTDVGKVKTYTQTRADAVTDPMTDQGKTMFFGLEAGAFAVVPATGGLMVGRVTDVTVPDSTPAGTEEISAGMGQTLSQEALALYVAALQREYGVKINRHLLATMYGPGNEGY
ncbi:MAG: peptidyl-prolyl cis-trans isomerase, partial [Alphaproteobacteria bacterium]|nr:peptidyl-prolyl cis-trans isomerase [Alphaproteobacteria bacterium]